jgi:hypothetical protein
MIALHIAPVLNATGLLSRVARLLVQLECQAVVRPIFYKLLILLSLVRYDLAEARCETTFAGKNSDCTQNTPRENPLERFGGKWTCR